MKIGFRAQKWPALIGQLLLLSALFNLGACIYEEVLSEDDLERGNIDNLGQIKHNGQAHNARHSKVLLPAGTTFSPEALKAHLRGTSAEVWETFQLEEWEVKPAPPVEMGQLKPTSASLFGASAAQDCKNNGHDMRFATGDSEKVPYDLSKTFKIFWDEAQVFGDTYNKDLIKRIGEILNDDASPSYWFRLSGSSVWLKDYNVHFVVSRMMYAQERQKHNPRVSLVYAQIFDENWNEIEDSRLVFPTNEVNGSHSFEAEGQHFRSYRFPRFLPVPMMIGPDSLYGAEDPRITLVRNKNGYEEPIVVFNAFHIKILKSEEKEEILQYRSIFMTFPFQVQLGKQLLIGGDGGTDKEYFSRTKQVMIKGQRERRVEKNWTPFVSKEGDYDEHVMFATSLKPLRVIKCELWTQNTECELVADHGNEAVAELRGGSPLLSISSSQKEDSESFLGIARMSLDCGCGMRFYRPNLVVVKREGPEWSLSHVSSSLDLGMDIVPWSEGRHVCDNWSVNAMIPNGVESIDHELDLVTVYASVSDMTVERVTINGILKALSSFELNKKGGGDSDGGRNCVACALDASMEFCKEYAAKHKKIEDGVDSVLI